MISCTWGQFRFQVYEPNTTVWNNAPGVYIFTRLTPNGTHWVPLYVGETENFSNRLPSHERWPEALGMGATHIHAMTVDPPQMRFAISALGYTCSYDHSASDKRQFVVTGWTSRMKMDDQTVIDWTGRMCDAGCEHDCEFDGWGTNPKQP